MNKKKLKMFLVALLSCLGFAACVNAEEYGTEFQKFAGDGTITITSSSMESDLRINLIGPYIQAWNEENGTQFRAQECNESYDTCTIYLDSNNYEQHDIKIQYKENYSDQFKNVTNGTLTMHSSTNGTIQSMINSYLYGFTNEEGFFMIPSCNEDASMCDIVRYEDVGYNNIEVERHAVKINYKEEYSEQFKKVTNDGTLTLYGDTISTQENMLRSYMNNFSEYGKIAYFVGECNQDATVCDIILSNYYKPENSEYYTTREIERHVVKITYKKEYSENFKKLTSDGKITLKSGTVSDKRNLLYFHLEQFGDNYSNPERKYYSVDTCNENQTMCDVVLYKSKKAENGSYSTSIELERHAVNITYNEEYSEEFKKAISETITLYGSTTGAKQNLIYNYFSIYYQEDYDYRPSHCNEDASMCDVVLYKYNDNRYSETERHPVKVIYGEEQFSEVFKKLTDNKKLTIKALKPTDQEEADFIISSYLKSFATEKGYFYVSACNEDNTHCDIVSTETGETHVISITYESNLDSNISAIVNDMKTKNPGGKKFLLEDLELINYYASVNFKKHDFGDENTMINFSSEAKAFLGNMTGILDGRMGWGDPLTSGCFGGFAIMYNGTIYAILGGGAQKNNVIYIPDNTTDTQNAYIAAAQKRINEYLKNENVKITHGGKVSELMSELYPESSDMEWLSENIGFNINEIENYYNITYKGNTIPFLIIKDSSKIKEKVEYVNNDIITGISISTSSSNVPLDTTIQANEIKKDNEQYKAITTKLNVKEALIYDLKLFSSTTKQFISKIEDGLFEIKIPIPESLLNKDLAAYYIHDDGTIEEHPITIVDGIAHFTTSHFSVYTITEKIELEDKNKEPIPDTYDNIMNYIVLGIVSIITLGTTMVYYRKRMN